MHENRRYIRKQEGCFTVQAETERHIHTYNLLNSPVTEVISNGTSAPQLIISDGTTKQYKYDCMNYLTSISEGNEAVLYSYDARGQEISEAYENVTKSTSYNNTGMISGYSIYIGNAERLNVSYEYNVNGQITKVYENGSLKTEYKYDLLNRLMHEDYANRNTVFAHTTWQDFRWR